MGKTLAKAINPNPSIAGSRPGTVSVNPRPRAATKGTVTVEVVTPDGMGQDDACKLARKLALARVVATADNPDAPEDAACEDYAEEASHLGAARSEHDWDNTKIIGISGMWST